ncbi:MAG TPA: ABC transporter permease [Thermomicrobiales bacterium]|nr:ABC transporter permease [Thermomicrobiales bacterium]
MLNYLFQRLLLAIPTLLGVSVLVFVAIRLVPGDAVTAMLGTEAGLLTETQRASLEAYFGLDKSPVQQYISWLGNVLHGDLGYSVRLGQPVLELILDRFPVTLELALLSTLVAVAAGIPLGVVAAVYRDTPADFFGRLFALIGLAAPNFLVATVLIYVLSVYFGYLPNSGNYVGPTKAPFQNLEQMMLPALTLGLAFSASVMRTTRSAMLEVLGQDYVRTARAKGLRDRVVIGRHALRNALIPVVTLTGIELGYLLGGTVIIEQVFALPGLGRLTLNAIAQRDYALIQGATLFIACVVVLVNLLVDLGYAAIDPRISYGDDR